MTTYLTPLQQRVGVSADKTFVDEVGAFLAAHGIEGKEPSPYPDDKGIPTVGIGINLQAYTAPYLVELGIDPQSVEGQVLAGVFRGTYLQVTGKDSNGNSIYDGPDQGALDAALGNV